LPVVREVGQVLFEKVRVEEEVQYSMFEVLQAAE